MPPPARKRHHHGASAHRRIGASAHRRVSRQAAGKQSAQPGNSYRVSRQVRGRGVAAKAVLDKTCPGKSGRFARRSCCQQKTRSRLC
ncbi:MAG: hypothetical protein EOS28_32375 [Mesorhizobium sp.]|nr:MAG: hypothetical protein EOS28_32375 [Mesorhizobium sp.]